VVLESERWLELRRFRALHDSGTSVAEIARETGLNRRTVKKYLAELVPTPPRAAPRQVRRGQVVDTFTHVIDAWLRAELLIKGTVVHERLVDQYGFTGNYQRVKLYLQQARPRVAAELGIAPDQLAGLHRRFEVVPGAQPDPRPGLRAMTMSRHHAIKTISPGDGLTVIVINGQETVVASGPAPRWGRHSPARPFGEQPDGRAYSTRVAITTMSPFPS
jgi:AcrR family transcriptional regulator